MISFDQTITAYTREPFENGKTEKWTRTVIKDVSWAGYQQVVAETGFKPKDRYSVRIPKRSIPENFSAHNGDVVVLGEGIEMTGNNITEITKKYVDCFVVTSVHTDNLTRPLPHLRLEGE